MKRLTWLLRHFSMRRLALLSIGLTLLPMLAGMLFAYQGMGKLSDLSQQVVHNVATDARTGQELLDQLGDLERRGKQYLSQQDASDLKDFAQSHEQFNHRLRGLLDQALEAGDSLAPLLEAVAKEEKLAYESLVASYPVKASPAKPAKGVVQAPPPERSVGEFDWFAQVKSKTHDLLLGYAKQIDEEANSLGLLSYETKQSLLVYIVLLVAISLFVLVGFIYLLHTPIRQLDFFIRTLGAGNFTQPIHVEGTNDVEFLGERLEWLRTHLNDLEMAKQRFVRNVSHEIKTPLATMREGADLLLDEVVGSLNHEQKDIAKILLANADKMDRMIAELINYSQVSSRRTHQKLSLVDMRLLVAELLGDYRLQLRNKSVTVADSMEPVEIMGDREQLRTIIDNLLSNALKYSPEGGEIRLSLSKKGGHMVLEIEDDGPGIDPDEREKVFEPFFQGRSSRALGVKGTGFGLAIVAECVASHHGIIVVLPSHEDNAGARIKVQLPIQLSNQRRTNAVK